ncbi:hypothetical protein EDC96DRAFT_613126 [Choanephora cucurbitarum]|nr:hypothetical protein EDC96DRAFT_613126 [Choanephora cucurbitarum]
MLFAWYFYYPVIFSSNMLTQKDLFVCHLYIAFATAKYLYLAALLLRLLSAGVIYSSRSNLQCVSFQVFSEAASKSSILDSSKAGFENVAEFQETKLAVSDASARRLLPAERAAHCVRSSALLTEDTS